MAETTEAGTPWRRRRRIAWALGVVLSLLLLAGALAAVVAAPWGVRLVRPLIADAIAASVGGSAEIAGLEGTLWHGVTARRIEVHGTDGLAVRIDGLRLRWTLADLVHRVLRIDVLTATHVDVTLPQPLTSDSNMSHLPVAVRFGRIDLADVALRPQPGAAPQRFSLTGNLSVSRRIGGTAALHLRPLQNARDRLDATAAYDPKARTLALDVDLRAFADGMLWKLTGLPAADARDTRITITGKGPLADWHGDLKAEAAGVGRFDATVAAQLRDGKPVGFALDGSAVPRPAMIPAALAGLVSKIGIHMDGTLAVGKRAEVKRLELRLGDAGTVRGAATANLAAQTLDTTVDADVAPAVARHLNPRLEWQAAHLHLQAKGPLTAPVPTLQADLMHPAFAGVGAERLSLHLAAVSVATRQVSVRLAGQGVAWGEPTLDRLLGPSLSLTADGSRTGDRIAVRGAVLSAGHLTAQGAADLDIAAKRISGLALDARADGLGELPPLAGVLSKGGLDVALSKGTWSPEAGFQGDLRAAGQDLAFVPKAATAFVGPAPAVTGHVAVTPAGALAVQGLRLQAAGGTLSGHAGVSAGRRIDLNLDGPLATSPLKEVAGVEASTPPTVSLALSGPLMRPAGSLSVRWRQLRSHGTTLGAGHIETRFAWRRDIPSADVDAAAAWQGREVTAHARVVADKAAAVIESLSVQAGELRVTGSLRLPGYALPAAGKVRLDNFDLSLLRPIAGGDVAGMVNGTATLAARNGGQAVDLEISGRNLRRAPPLGAAVSVARLQATAHVDRAVAAPHGTLRLTLQTIQHGGLKIATLGATFDGGLDAGTLDFHFKGDEPVGEASGKLALATDAGGRRLTLSRFGGTLAGRAFSLAEPAILMLPRAGGLRLELALKAEKGRLRLAYQSDGKRSAADADIRRFPLALLPPIGQHTVADGHLDAAVHLEQPAGGATTGHAHIALDKLALKSTQDLAPLSATFDATLRQGMLDGRLSLDLPALETAHASAKVPVDVSLADGRFAVAKQGAVQGDAVLRGQLDQLWAYLPFPAQKLGGAVDATAKVGGRIGAPELSGRIRLSDGRYESLEWGTLLKNITVDARFSHQRLEIRTFTAEDGKGGRLAVSGHAEFGGTARARYDFAAKATNLLVVHRDDVSATVGADLTFQGAGASGKLAGTVTVTGAQIDLAAALPPSVPTLDVTRVDGGAVLASSQQTQKPPSAGDKIALDVQVDIPGQVFARGRGVDSEWQGKLSVKGTASTPKIYGQLGVKRGTLRLLSRDLQLGETKITFQGRTPPDPDLAMRAVYTGQGLQATIQVNGTAEQPKFAITSTPTLPQDEIMARMLFGKSRGKLSPVEAAQVATALDQLRGGGGLDVLGTIRSFVGLDRLNVGTSKSGTAELEAGRYITKDVYVGAKQGTTAGSGGVEVQVDVTPHVTVTTETKQDGNSNVGVNFKLDY